MPRREFQHELLFPFGGLHEYKGLERQPPGTTPSCQNVRAVDPDTGRRIGGQRAGSTRYINDRISDNPVQCIDHVVTTQVAGADSTGQSIIEDDTGGSFSIVDADGSITATRGEAGGTFHAALWDIDGNGYVAASTAADATDIQLYKVNASGVVQYEVDLLTLGGVSSDSVNMAFLNGVLYVAAETSADDVSLFRIDPSDGSKQDGGAWKTTSGGGLPFDRLEPDADRNRIMSAISGYIAFIARKTGVAEGDRIWILDLDADAFTEGEIVADDFNKEAVDITNDGTNFYVSAETDAGTNEYTVGKHRIDGTEVWTRSGTPTFADAHWGIAYDDVNGRLLVTGIDVFDAGSSIDLVSLSPNDGSTLQTVDVNDSSQAIAIDDDGNIRITGLDSGSNPVLLKLTADFSQSWSLSTNVESDQVAVNTGVLTGNRTRRQINLIQVTNGTVAKSDGSNWVTVTDGTQALAGGAARIFSTVLFQDIYFADGMSQKRYDAGANKVEDWPVTAGSFPVDSNGNKPELIETWRERIVLARPRGEPQNFFMPRAGDPTDFDYSPATPDVNQAIAGNVNDVGQCPDIINGIIPYSNDVLIFLCDHTIWQLRGDPAGGGEFDLLSNETGGAYGRAWCRSPDGTVFFWGSRGGLYQKTQGGFPERISREQVDERFLDIDLDNTLVSLEWDDRQYGVMIWVTPVVETGGATTHYFWDARNNAYFPDVYAANNFNPRATHVFDGDLASDRVVMFGGRDGFVRFIDTSNKDDDTATIDSFVFIGPIQHKDGMTRLRLMEIDAIMGFTETNTDNVDYSVHIGSEVRSALNAAAHFSGQWNAGRNRHERRRANARAMFLKLGNSASGESWTMERVLAVTKETGRRFSREF